MYEWDAARAQCWVLTRREGVLKRVGHDLRIIVERFSLTASAEQRTVELKVDATSLNVDCAIEGERRLPGVPSSKDRSSINEQLSSVVLRAQQHPEIRFLSQVLPQDSWQQLVGLYEHETDAPSKAVTIAGELSLCGATRPLSVLVQATSTGLMARATLDQTRFGIEPYRGMLGALRVSAHVDVCLQIPAHQHSPS